MTRSLSPGDEAPNFDLTSTEDVLLMLRDEVVRTAVVLYVCGATTTEAVQGDLVALARHQGDLLAASARALVLSSAPLEELKGTQRELHLPFPLLHDDRGFARDYGVEAPEEGEPAPALFLVNRRQTVVWARQPVGAVEEVMPEVLEALEALPSPTDSLPRTVVNRLVDRWVN